MNYVRNYAKLVEKAGDRKIVALDFDETQIWFTQKKRKQYIREGGRRNLRHLKEAHISTNLTMLTLLCSDVDIQRELPQAFLFRGKRLSHAEIEGMRSFGPPGSMAARNCVRMWNESGVMDEQLFCQWIKQWVPTLLDDHPEVFFIILADNHYSHWSLEACK